MQHIGRLVRPLSFLGLGHGRFGTAKSGTKGACKRNRTTIATYSFMKAIKSLALLLPLY